MARISEPGRTRRSGGADCLAGFGIGGSDFAADGGSRLIAHVYTRYFGDLSGGQILKKLLAGNLGLKSRELSFYDFPGIADAAAFKRDYRKALNQAAQEISDVDAIVAEAMSTFEHNIAVSESVKEAAAGRH